MKKFELVAAIAVATGVSQEKVNGVIDSLGSAIVKECVDNGGEINLPGLGKFKQKVNAARKGRNPLTGEDMDVKESHTLAFKPTATIKKVIEPKTTKKGKK